MKNRYTLSNRSLIALMLVLAMLLPCFTQASAEGTGWSVADDTQIYWVSGADSLMSDDALMEQIQLFDSELAAKVTNTALPIVYGEADGAGENDILLVLDSSLNIAKEGFQIKVNGGQVTVSASHADGLFYGCRDLIQQLLSTGVVADKAEAPSVAERAVSLDNGRKYFSVDWIKQLIREMSWAKMNTLVLHFSEEMGLGIESKLYPWLAGRDGTMCVEEDVATDNTYLTQEEVAEIVTYAHKYHIDIIPSFDSPGHMNYVVKKFNDKCASKAFSFTYNGTTYTAKAGSEIGNYFHYNNKTAIVQGSRNTKYSRGIDISNTIAVAFTRSLVEEYATLFKNLGCTKFDIGGDELLGWGASVDGDVAKWKQLNHWETYAIQRTGNSNAVAYDAFLLYMNDLYDLVTGLGYTSVRMWNDDALRSNDTGWKGVVTLNPNIDIWYWSAEANSKKNSVWTYLTAGYQTYNILSDYNYYVMNKEYYSSSRKSFTQAYADQIYNEWNPFVFDPTSTTLGTGKNTAAGNANVLGGAFGIWCDNPSLKTEAAVMTDLLPLIRANGAKCWDYDCNKSMNYTAFTNWYNAVGNAPSNLPAAPAVEEYSRLDVTGLNAALEEFEAMDAAAYTAESFGAYTKAVTEARAIAQSSTATQETLDAALAKIANMKALLRSVDTVSDKVIISSAKSRSTRVVKGKVVTITLVAKETIQGVEVYDDLGNRVILKAYSVSRNATSTKYTVSIQFVENNKGTRTYTIYVIDQDGNRSADYKQCRVLCY
jgi:hypothetical protein